MRDPYLPLRPEARAFALNLQASRSMAVEFRRLIGQLALTRVFEPFQALFLLLFHYTGRGNAPRTQQVH